MAQTAAFPARNLLLTPLPLRAGRGLEASGAGGMNVRSPAPASGPERHGQAVSGHGPDTTEDVFTNA